MTEPTPPFQVTVLDPLRPSARLGPGMRGEHGYRLYPPANMAIDYAMGILTLKYDSLLRSASSPCQVVATDFNRKTESVDLGNVMVPGDILQFEGMDLERIPHTSSTTLTWQSIITRQEHIKFIGVYWIHYVPASLDGRHTGYHVGVPDLWCIIRFYPWSSIIKLPFELVVYFCVLLGPVAWAACLGIFILPGAPLFRFFLSIGVGVVSLVLTLLTWKRWLGYPVRVPLCSIVRLWCGFLWREVLRKKMDGSFISSV